MRRAFVLVLLGAFVVSAVAVYADYDKEATVKAMRNNLASLGKAQAAAANGDFYAAAEGLMSIASNALMLSAMDPPKGSKADWEAIQKELARAVFRAIGACGNGDKAALEAALKEIVAIRGKGHGTFRG